MTQTAEEFYRSTLGKTYEMDGAPARDPVQCADYFKKACLDVLGYHWATGGDGYVDYFWYNRASHAAEFDFVTDWRQFRNGDFVIWPHSKRDATTPFFYSHIAMFWRKSDGKSYMVGQNQPKKYVTEKVESDYVWSKALGAMRFKKWSKTMEILPYGMTELVYNGTRITAVRGPKAKGYDLHLLSGDGPKSVKNIVDFDSDKLTILAGVNANYFRMDTGEHLGCEGDGVVQGYQQIVPLQKGWLAYFQRKGETACWESNAYFYDQKDVDFVCTPYAVRMLHGQIVFKRSINCGDKDDIKNTQTAALKFKNGDWAVAIFDSCFPRDVCSWAQTLEGIQDVILMDSGGSTQMFECTTGARKVVKSTGRKVSNVLVIAKVITSENPSMPVENAPAAGDTPAIIDDKTDEKLKTLETENAQLKTENAALKAEIHNTKEALVFVESSLNNLLSYVKNGREDA